MAFTDADKQRADITWGPGNWVICDRDDHKVFRADNTPMTPIMHSTEYHDAP